MRPEQLGDFRTPSDAHLSPDGERVAFVVTQMNIDEDRYEHQIWMWNGSAAEVFTSGLADSSPRWSADGSSLAFLRKAEGDDAKPQIALIPVGGGEASVVTDFPNGVSAFAWSPDGSRIVAQASEFIDGIDDEAERARAPRRITHPSFRYDNVGWTYDKVSHFWIVDLDGGDPVQLTSGEYSEASAVWSPDGASIAYLSSAHEDRWRNPLNQVFVIDADGGEPHAMTPLGAWMWVGYAPDGTLHAIGEETDKLSLNPLPIVRFSDSGSLEVLTDLDRNLMPGHPPGILAAPRFLSDGTIHAVLEDRGMQRVISVTPAGSVSDVVGGQRVVTGWDPSLDGSSAVLTSTDPTQPGEVYWWDGSDERPLTALNEEFSAQASLASATEFTFESDGEEIHGWVLLPPGDGKVPMLLNIHGGPAAQHSWGFFDEFQVYVDAGYGVVGTNPRGSSGYGFDHVTVPCGRWSEDVPPDQLDLKSAPHAAAALFPRLDTENMGIMGGSYGGLSTVMITSMDNGYKSAVAERGVYNWVSMAGTSDIPFFMELYLGTDMPHGVDEIWNASPLARAHKITTPTLVLHSETDYRCPVEQGQQLFSILYREGVDTELLLFPTGEGHELSRSGSPKHRVERFTAILDWHARYLKS